MAHISGFERSQLLLLPEAVDDYVGADNPVRFIDAFVDGLDLVEAGFARVQPRATGRPGYAPGDLLKLYIYGYLNRVRSSRRLEAECPRNIELIWLVRTLKPDFKTIADFRADNRVAFKSVFRQFTLLCKRLDLFGRELLAVDGTRIKAVNNKDRNFTQRSLEKFIKAADERLEDYLKRLDEGDVLEAGTGRRAHENLAEKIEALGEKRGRYGAMLAELERTGESQISLTDPDSRAMAAHTKVAVGYNIQTAVDAKNKMIVEQEVTNQVVDMRLLQATAEPARAILEVDRIDVVADAGYFRTEDIEACEKAGLTPHVPRPQRGSSASKDFFRKDEFRYDAERDAYVCPARQVLATRYESKLRDMKKVDYANRAACPVCPLRSRCTNDFRKVSRLENEAALDRMAERLKARPDILDRRRETVEHPFRSIKQWMNQGAFLMRGLDKVRAEFSLTARVYNLRRVLNILGVEKLMEAVAAKSGPILA
jgi:transposase/IS5 family transposase